MSIDSASLPEITLGISIAVLYPMFFSKIIDTMYDDKNVRDMCQINITKKDDVNYDELEKCQDSKTTKLKEITTAKFVTYLVVGTFALVLSYVLSKRSLVLGFSFAGLLSIFWGSYIHWDNMRDITKSGMLGLTLLALIAMPFILQN